MFPCSPLWQFCFIHFKWRLNSHPHVIHSWLSYFLEELVLLSLTLRYPFISDNIFCHNVPFIYYLVLSHKLVIWSLVCASVCVCNVWACLLWTSVSLNFKSLLCRLRIHKCYLLVYCDSLQHFIREGSLFGSNVLIDTGCHFTICLLWSFVFIPWSSFPPPLLSMIYYRYDSTLIHIPVMRFCNWRQVHGCNIHSELS